MRLRFSIALLVTLFCATAALAASVTNKDDKDHKLTVREGDAKLEQTLKPGGVLDGVCLKGCTVRLGNSEDDEYVLEGPEVLTIEDNKLYDDSVEAKPDAVPGLSTQPPPPLDQPPAAPSK